MNILRRLFLTVCGAVLGFSLLAMAWTHVGTATIGSRDTVKSWLDESGFYDHAVEAFLESANQEAGEDEAQIPVDDPQIQAIAKNAFSPQFLRENVEKVLDGTYAWLEGETPKPEFTIDLNGAKQRLADGLGDYAGTRAASLPVCTPDQAAAMQESFDALNAPCLPTGVDPSAAAAQLRADIMSSEGLLADTTFTGDDLKVTENGQEVNLDDSQYQRVQDAYRWAGLGPYFFGILSLLLVAAIVFLSSSKQSGLRRVGIIMIVSGGVLALFWLAFNRSSSWLDSWAENLSGETSAGRELAAGLARAINGDVSGLLMWYAIIFIVLGLAAILVPVIYRRNTPAKPEQLGEPEPPVDDSRKPGPQPAANNAPKPGKKPPRKIQL